jgi:hypothetical protein
VCDSEILDGLAADQMLLDDALEICLVTMSIPDSFRVDDGDGSFRTDPQAIGLRTEYAALRVDESEFVEAFLEELPGFFLLTGRRAVAADTEKDVSLIVAEVQFGSDAFETRDCGSFVRHRRSLYSFHLKGSLGVYLRPVDSA